MKKIKFTNTLVQYQLLIIAAGTAFPIYGYFLMSSVPLANDSLFERSIQSSICFLVLFLTCFSSWFEKNIEKIIYFFAFFFSLWDVYTTSRNIHSHEYVFSLMITFMVAGLILPDIRTLSWYAVMMFISVPVAGYIFGEPEWALPFYFMTFYTMAFFSLIIMAIHLRVKQRLADANRDLKKVNHELDSFIYRASHDLTAPLNSIQGIINLVYKSGESNALNREYLSMMEKSITKLKYYIHDLLNFSRNSKMEMQIHQIDFNLLVASTLRQLGYNEQTHPLRISTKIRNSVPFFSDPKRMEIIFNNIISNSMKYLDIAKEKPELNIRITATKRNAAILFQDNGIGILPEHLPKIFNMFYRASHVSTGTGVGLYIVKEVVEKLGGTISATTEPGKGTVFSITLANNTMIKGLA